MSLCSVLTCFICVRVHVGILIISEGAVCVCVVIT